MSVSGKEKPGVIARQSSICSSGVPIKKRKFPLFRHSSPPPQEQFSLVENKLVQSKHSEPSQETLVLNNDATTRSPERPDANKSSFSQVKKENPTEAKLNLAVVKPNLPVSKPPESSVTFESSSLDDVESKEKVMETVISAHPKKPVISELHLSPINAFAEHVGMLELSKQQVVKEAFRIAGNMELSLGLKEHLVPPIDVQSGEGSHHMLDKLSHSSLPLPLNEEKCSNPCKSVDANTSNDNGNVRANRSNWDLNTTMDAWEDSAGNIATTALDTGNFNIVEGTGGTCDIKPLLNAGMLGVGRGKQILGVSERMPISPVSSLSHGEDPLHLSLGTSFCQGNFKEDLCGSSAKVSGKVVTSSNVPGLSSTGNKESVSCGSVKPEPVDENARHDCVGAQGNTRGLLKFRSVKKEAVECGMKSDKFPNPKIGECGSVKCEPVQGDNMTTQTPTELISQKTVVNAVQFHEKVASTMTGVSSPQTSSSPGLPTCSELSIGVDTANISDNPTSTKNLHINVGTTQQTCDRIAAKEISVSGGYENKDLIASDVQPSRTEDSNFDNPQTCDLKANNNPLASYENAEDSGSDEEKVNISADMVEEDAYGSDYDSDGTHALAGAMDADDQRDGRQRDGREEEYEDGEVREQLMYTAAECSVDESETKNANLGDHDNKNLATLGFHHVETSRTLVEEKIGKLEDVRQMGDDHIKECVDAVVEKAVQVVDKEGSEESTVEDATAGKQSIIDTQGRLFDQSGRNDAQKGHDKELLFDGATYVGQGTENALGLIAGENVKGTATMDTNDINFSKAQAPLNGNDAATDVSAGANRSRIIHLPRASNVTSPCKTLSMPNRAWSSMTRGRCADFDGEKYHLRRNRDDLYTDGPRKFERDRFQDQPFRNSRLNFGRGRGRLPRRLDSRGEWDSDRNLAPEIYNCGSDYRYSRHKRTPLGDTELEYNGYDIAPDRILGGSGRGGRKPMGDGLPSSFRPASSRRLSPGGRDGPSSTGIQMVRRITRNISPSRPTGEDGPDSVGFRHGEKFTRGLPDDMDPVFSRPRPSFEGQKGQFIRGNINFSSVQRRGLTRIRSKSPIRSRTRSPGPGSSPRRRSPDEFNGLPEATQRRSPAMFRMERIRSPDRSCFPEETVSRRRSPPYMVRPPNELRDMDSGRVHCHPRSIPNRSPSDRGLPRGTRRFDILDPRDRNDNEEYFRGPIRAGRFHELGGEGSGDEQRKCGERRGIVRSFRPRLNDIEGENFRFRVEDGPRPFRFCPETDTDFIERSNLRERDFDRRVKNRPVMAPRRMQNIEEQEENYRQSGQEWHEEGFNDVSQVKRRRF